MKIATKLKNAAQITAWCGRSTPVETTVAIEFAASWNPFMKSKTSASATSSTRVASGMVRSMLRRSRRPPTR